MYRYLILVVLICSCASRERTRYGPYSKKSEGGYRVRVIDDGLRLVSFKSNPYTKKNLTRTFAEFRAIEICLDEDAKLASFLEFFDRSKARVVTRTRSSGYPSYYYGVSPFWNRYYGFGYGIGWNTQSGSSWDEKIQYPEAEVVFECANQVHRPQLTFREVSAEEMKHLVKDLRGGLQIDQIPDDSPNRQRFQVGDIILRGNGERLQEVYQLLAIFKQSKNHSVEVEILRDGKLLTGLELVGVDVTKKALEVQEDIIGVACKQEDLKKMKLCLSRAPDSDK